MLPTISHSNWLTKEQSAIVETPWLTPLLSRQPAAACCARVIFRNSGGAGNRLSLYELSSLAPSPTSTPSPVSVYVRGYEYVGCQSDNIAARTLSSLWFISSYLTLEQCASFCKGYTYFGMFFALLMNQALEIFLQTSMNDLLIEHRN